MREELAIGEVAARAGIATSAIRYYEAEGLLPPARRRAGRRVYAPEVLDRLGFIALAKQAGCTVAETRRLLTGFTRGTPPGVRWRDLAKRKLAELDARIAETQRMRNALRLLVRCECPTLEDCARALRAGRSS